MACKMLTSVVPPDSIHKRTSVYINADGWENRMKSEENITSGRCTRTPFVTYKGWSCLSIIDDDG